MPLSDPAPREKLHTRQIRCEGYQRADGLWDIEGHLTDVKTYPFHNEFRGDMQPGTPLHGMSLRLTVDDAMHIHAVEAVSDHTPYAICPQITPNFQRLVGQRIGPGWRRKLRELLGGTEGCTHLVELLGPVATTAFQTINSRSRNPEAADSNPDRFKRLINSCFAWGAHSEVVQRWAPKFYLGPQAADPAPDAKADTGR